MLTNHHGYWLNEFLGELWRDVARNEGFPHREPSPVSWATSLDLSRSEWSAQFEAAMRSRLVMGALRYGPLGDGNKPSYDRIAAAIKRLQKFVGTQELDLLVDAANLCLVEFVEGKSTLRHWSRGDSDDHVTSH